MSEHPGQSPDPHGADRTRDPEPRPLLPGARWHGILYGADPARIPPRSGPTPVVSGLPHLPLLPFTAPWHYELHFPRDPRGPGIARATIRAVLTAHGLAELVDRAELLACELATNSVRHTKGPASVQLRWLHPVLRVSVWDMGPDLPTLPGSLGAPPARPGEGADSGRGLLILDAVADRWGGCAVEDGLYGPGGKTLWFELTLAVPPPDGGSASAFAA
ncbi:putative anti-sigma regulatory factor, serine/threonine protein kinase [Actinobacteria bacterium OK074]|nr:putative anti-sigma regulatory factor, serine/threonine protein kinase [Actinobacteria bacterium OK074]